MYDRDDFRYLVLGGCIMCFFSSYLSVGALYLWGWTVGHSTGIAARSGINLSQRDYKEFGLGFGILSFFMIGAGLSASLVGNAKFQLGRRYGFALIIESILIFIGFFIEEFSVKKTRTNDAIALWLFALASGFQNAMCTTFSGAVIRTTHITGTVTDIGAVIGLWLRYRKSKPNRVELWKLRVLVPLLVSYVIGAIVGAITVNNIKHWYLLVPASGFGLVGLFYTSLRLVVAKKTKRRSKIFSTIGELPANSPLPVAMPPKLPSVMEIKIDDNFDDDDDDDDDDGEHSSAAGATANGSINLPVTTQSPSSTNHTQSTQSPPAVVAAAGVAM